MYKEYTKKPALVKLFWLSLSSLYVIKKIVQIQENKTSSMVKIFWEFLSGFCERKWFLRVRIFEKSVTTVKRNNIK